MKYVKPLMQSYSKEDIRNNIIVSATCKYAVCVYGTAFTCSAANNYVCRTPDEIV